MGSPSTDAPSSRLIDSLVASRHRLSAKATAQPLRRSRHGDKVTNKHITNCPGQIRIITAEEGGPSYGFHPYNFHVRLDIGETHRKPTGKRF